jgi:2-oxoglutarate dehydrogenase E2 component (dihydrolipoamide succinyltransferase)
MPTEVKVPALGESIVEATISKWLKQEGDTVSNGEPLVELETDKVNLEVAAEQDGVLERILKGEGETVNIGDALCMIGAGNGAGQAAASPAEQKPASQEQPSGNGKPAAPAQPQPAAAPAAAAESTESTENDVFATPVAQRVAAEHDLDIRKVTGSGPGGRITKEDVLGFLDQERSAAAPARPGPQVAEPERAAPPQKPAGTAATPSAPAERPAPTPQTPPPTAQSAIPAQLAPTATRREERMRMSRRRQTIARRLVEAQRQAAMLTTFNEVDMSAVMELRQRRKDAFKERHGIGLGFMSFFARAAVGALKAFPLLNAEIQGDEIVIKHYYDIGVAVGTEEGLVVPVVRDADRKSFAAIEHEISELAQRARAGKLGLADLQGGSFTITNGGIYGSLMSTPILNTPQVGILGMHKIEERPVADNGAIVIRPMMYLALSYDHRIVDGSEAVRFLVRIKELIEDPEALLLEG